MLVSMRPVTRESEGDAANTGPENGDDVRRGRWCNLVFSSRFAGGVCRRSSTVVTSDPITKRGSVTALREADYCRGSGVGWKRERRYKNGILFRLLSLSFYSFKSDAFGCF